jgi:hypothetical protein
VASTRITVASGETFHVQGTTKEVEASIVAAARGSIMELVWLTDLDSTQSIAINPEYVVALRPGSEQ